MTEEAQSLVLSPCQSLALRDMIEAMKADDTIYEQCPDVVRKALCKFLMPPYTTAEAEIKALREAGEQCIRIIERFGKKIQDLESQLKQRSVECARSRPATPSTMCSGS